MYTVTKPKTTSLHINETYYGETIERKINRIVNNKEPISDGAPIIFTERKDGVNPDHDIRTDRFEHAIEAMDKVTKSNLARREQTIGEKGFENMTIEQKQEFVKKYPNSKYKSWTPPKEGQA